MDLWQTISFIVFQLLAPLNISNILPFTLLIISIIPNTQVYKSDYVLSVAPTCNRVEINLSVQTSLLSNVQNPSPL